MFFRRSAQPKSRRANRGGVGKVRRGATFVPRIETLERRDLLTAAELNVFDGSTGVLVNDTIDLGTTPIGSAVSRSLTIENTGDADLDLDATSLSLPAGYSLVTAFASTVAPCDTTILVIQADASTPGTFSGTVSFASNDADENPFSFSLTIGVTAPEIEVLDEDGEPIENGTGSLDFGETTEGDELTMNVTIANTGDADLLLDAPSLSLPAGFSLVGSVPSLIGAGDVAWLEIQLDAASVGSFSGAVSIGTNDSDVDPFTFSVVGIVNANQPPSADSIPAVVIPVAPEVASVDLCVYFMDFEDGPDLRYSIVENSNPSMFATEPTISAGYVSLSAASGTAGSSATLIVRGTDHHGAYFQVPLTVTVALPVISIIERKHTGETASDGFFELKREGDQGNTLTVNVSLSGSAIIGTDYTATNTTTVTFPANNTDTVKVTITPVDDSDQDGSESVELTLLAGTAYALDDVTQRSIFVHDDDQGAFVFISHAHGMTNGADGFFIIESIGKLKYQVVHNPDPSYTGPLPPSGGYYWHVDGLSLPFSSAPVPGSSPPATFDYLAQYEVNYRIVGTVGAPGPCPGGSPVESAPGQVTMGPGKCVRLPIPAAANVGNDEITLKLLPNASLAKSAHVTDSGGTYLGSVFVTSYAIEEPPAVPSEQDACSTVSGSSPQIGRLRDHKDIEIWLLRNQVKARDDLINALHAIIDISTLNYIGGLPTTWTGNQAVTQTVSSLGLGPVGRAANFLYSFSQNHISTYNQKNKSTFAQLRKEVSLQWIVEADQQLKQFALQLHEDLINNPCDIPEPSDIVVRTVGQHLNLLLGAWWESNVNRIEIHAMAPGVYHVNIPVTTINNKQLVNLIRQLRGTGWKFYAGKPILDYVTQVESPLTPSLEAFLNSWQQNL